MDRSERVVTGVCAVLTAVLGGILTREGLTGGPGAGKPVILFGLAAAYATLSGLLTWHLCAGVPAEGYLSGQLGWLILTRRWLGAILLSPFWILWPVHVLLRRSVARGIVGDRHPGEKVRHRIFEAGGDGMWALSERALYVVSPEGDIRRIALRDILSVRDAPLGPWARTEVLLTVDVQGDWRQEMGTFTQRAARRFLKQLEQGTAPGTAA
jgi:hypothetical protein